MHYGSFRLQFYTAADVLSNTVVFLPSNNKPSRDMRRMRSKQYNCEATKSTDKHSIMKYLAIASALVLAPVSAFTAVSYQPRPVKTCLLAGEYEPMQGEGKINLKVRGI
jgi:hypothetical protein